MVINLILVFLISAIIGLIIAPFIIYLCKRLKVSQTILHYVDKHKKKEGTPTMGGLIFILASFFSILAFLNKEGINVLFCFAVTFGYALLGFLDDFIKVYYKQNEGLKPYQKIIGQVGLSIIVSLYVYFNIGTSIEFFNLEINLGIFIIPFVILTLVATTNSVNLTDGLDGLAGGVSFVYIIFFGIILAVSSLNQNYVYALSCFAFAGGLLAFLLFNFYPAKIFMGDTGSLAIGGFISMMAFMTRKEFLIVFMGIMFVLSAVSDIIQVLHYKRTKKRIFLMAPLHHHIEQKNVHENKIVIIYIFITIIVSSLMLIYYLL